MMDRTVHGALHLLSHLASQIPVCRGERLALGTQETEEPYAGQWPEDRVSQIPASEMLHNLANRYPGELTVICHSPLTTEAMFLRKYPRDAELLKQIIVVANRTENRQEKGFDFEPAMDNRAAEILLASDARVKWIPIDALTMTEDRKEFVSQICDSPDTMIGRFLRHSTISRKADEAVLSAAAGLLTAEDMAESCKVKTVMDYPALNTELVTQLHFEQALAPGFGITDTPELLEYYRLHEGEHHHDA